MILQDEADAPRWGEEERRKMKLLDAAADDKGFAQMPGVGRRFVAPLMVRFTPGGVCYDLRGGM